MCAGADLQPKEINLLCCRAVAIFLNHYILAVILHDTLDKTVQQGSY